MIGPAHLGDRAFGLRAGGVKHQHINRAETAADGGGQLGDLLPIGNVGAEAPGHAAIVTDGAADLFGLPVAAPAIDRDGKPSSARRRAIAAPSPASCPSPTRPVYRLVARGDHCTPPGA